MNAFHVLSLGAFIQAGAHYVHGGPTSFYVIWSIAAGVMAGISMIVRRPT